MYPTAFHSKIKLSLKIIRSIFSVKLNILSKYNSSSFSSYCNPYNLPLHILHRYCDSCSHSGDTIILYMMHAFTIALIKSKRKFAAATTSINDCSCHTELVLSTKYE